MREDYPLLSKGIIYFDNAATSLTPRQVVDSMMSYLLECRANVGRGSYPLAIQATNMYEEVRRKVAKFIGARASEVAFVKNTTEAINIVAMGIKWSKGDNVVTTALEHHSNMLPWIRISKLYGVEVRYAMPRRDGTLTIDEFERLIDDNTKLVSVAHVSNVLGTISPVREIAKIAKSRGALLLVDAAQSAPHMPINVKELGCDFLAFSAHKMCGPPGVGVLYVEESVQVDSLTVGGGVVLDASLNDYKLLDKPHVFEAGTPPISDVIGFGAALDYLSRLGLVNIMEHEVRTARMLSKLLREVADVRVLGPEVPQTGIVSFAVNGVRAEDVALALGNLNICVRAGFHCAIPLVRDLLNERYGVIRASLYLYNTEEEVEKFISSLREVIRLLKA
ncbi:MAG: cysteine desulfurase [Candidatus Nezhaarchaeota archaeon]|nr:cysteine desulfurase [Candidatus Nezhaarchaeota archaeon]